MYVQIQQEWRSYVEDVHKLCTPEFWKIFETVRKQSGTCIQAVLAQTHQLLARVGQKRKWPQSGRSLRNLISRKVGNFWDLVSYTCHIDLSCFNLPGVTKVMFRYIDPVYVWIRQCNELHSQKYKLEWDPKVLKHPVTGERCYGAGVEYGLLMSTVTASLPPDGRPALINLSWDAGDTVYKARSAVPIQVQVMNTNVAPACALGGVLSGIYLLLKFRTPVLNKMIISRSNNTYYRSVSARF